MTEKEEQALKGFLQDISCLNRLSPWENRVNLFEVLKISHMEIRHSNMLAWLLDPNENHQIGDRFIREFVNKVVSKIQNSKQEPLKLLLQDFYSYQVYRESDHIDIKLVSKKEKTAYIIENKVWSGESSHQLKDYYHSSQKEYAGYSILYIFLSPDGHDSSDPATWITFSYKELIDALQIAKNGLSIPEEVELLVNHYISAVRKNIMKEKDEELVKVCNEIYNKHRNALRLIFENINMNSTVESEIICSTLKELDQEGKIVYLDNNGWTFFTEKMNEYLPELQGPNSSWGTNYIYCYWFEKSGDELILHLELGGAGLSDELKEKELKLIEVSNKKKKNSNDFRYSRLFLEKEKINTDDYEKSLKHTVQSLVGKALKNEEEILGKARGDE